jgi:hypothetical protein
VTNLNTYALDLQDDRTVRLHTGQGWSSRADSLCQLSPLRSPFLLRRLMLRVGAWKSATLVVRQKAERFDMEFTPLVSLHRD